LNFIYSSETDKIEFQHLYWILLNSSVTHIHCITNQNVCVSYKINWMNWKVCYILFCFQQT